MVRSVLIQVAEIVKEIQLRVVVINQLELVVPVVGWLAASHHGHRLRCLKAQCLKDRLCGETDGAAAMGGLSGSVGPDLEDHIVFDGQSPADIT